MKTELTTTEAARHLGDYLARIRHTGDRFVLTKSNRPVAELGPVPGGRRTTLRGLWEAMREADVDEDFADDLERVNAADTVMTNPWH
jgi:prevent-host-death family protein